MNFIHFILKPSATSDTTIPKKCRLNREEGGKMWYKQATTYRGNTDRADKVARKNFPARGRSTINSQRQGKGGGTLFATRGVPRVLPLIIAQARLEFHSFMTGVLCPSSRFSAARPTTRWPRAIQSGSKVHSVTASIPGFLFTRQCLMGGSRWHFA